MNVAEKLSREIARVAILRERYMSLDRMPGVNVKFVLVRISNALDIAHAAAGVDDALEQIAALRELEGFTE